MQAIAKVFERAMTVRDLRELLADQEDDAPVVFVCDYGDITHTQQAMPVATCDCYVSDDFAESAYSKSGIALVDDSDEYDEDEDDRDYEGDSVIVLQS